jgi:hypothetical protein
MDLQLFKKSIYKNLNNYYYLHILKTNLLFFNSFFLFNYIYYDNINYKLLKYFLYKYNLSFYFLKNKNLNILYKKYFKYKVFNRLFNTINSISFLNNIQINLILNKKFIIALNNNIFIDLIYLKLDSHKSLISNRYLLKIFLYGNNVYLLRIKLLFLLIFYKILIIKLLKTNKVCFQR